MEAVFPESIENARSPVRRRVDDLSATAWLDLWERGRGQTSAQRALAWLQAARSEEQDDPAFWTISERDAQVLFLRESAFGLEMEGSAHCPRCGERLELQFTTREILPRVEMPGGDIAVELEDCAVRFRLPVVGNLADLSAFTPDTARNELLAHVFSMGSAPGSPSPLGKCPKLSERPSRKKWRACIEQHLWCPIRRSSAQGRRAPPTMARSSGPGCRRSQWRYRYAGRHLPSRPQACARPSLFPRMERPLLTRSGMFVGGKPACGSAISHDALSRAPRGTI